MTTGQDGQEIRQNSALWGDDENMHVSHPNDPDPDAKVRLVEEALKTIMEHFDCVQFLGSYDDPTGTINIYRGNGNWYARQGMAHDFLARDQAQTQAHEFKHVLPSNPPDEGESWKE